MNKDNKDDNDLSGFELFLIIVAWIALVFILGKCMDVPELQGVFGC